MKEKFKIAVIEDEEILSKALVSSLKDAGFNVVTAFDGEAGLELILKEKPDLVLLDLLMPKQDGLYVIEEVRKNPEYKLIPIIVLSNFAGDLEIKRALKIGADDYFVKAQHPMEEVIDKVKEYLFGGKPANPPKVGT